MPHHWLILGAGGHGRSVADAIRAQGDAVLGFLDDNRSADELVAGVPVLGPLRLAWDGAPAPDRFVVAFGNPWASPVFVDSCLGSLLINNTAF